MKDGKDRTAEVLEKVESLLLDLQLLSVQLGEWPDYDDHVFFHKPKAELAKPNIRPEYLVNKCRGKRVLHFGFVDSPFTEERIKSGELLHKDIAAVSTELWGADIDKAGIATYERITGDKNCWELDICQPLKDPKQFKKNFDIILFGEILEHLMSPGEALKNLRKLCEINDAELIITTPNAFNAAGFIAALLGNEIVHPEHYYYYSPVTLRRLLSDCGFSKVDISFYSGSNTANAPGLTYPGLIATCRC